MGRLIPNALYPSSLRVSFFSVLLSADITDIVIFVPDDPKRNRVLILDLLALHMLRTSAESESSTIISYHPNSEWKTTPAESLYSRVYLVGQSVYWQKIFANSDDPTFVLLATLWYALYSWDESFEILWEHICQLVRCMNCLELHTNFRPVIRSFVRWARTTWMSHKSCTKYVPISFSMPLY